MSFGKKSAPAPAPATAPPPEPSSEKFFIGDQLQSERMYDTASKLYNTRVFLTPEEEKLRGVAQEGLYDSFLQAQDSIGMSPERLAGLRDAYTMPQIQATNEAFDDARARAYTRAASTGMMDSAGFAKFLGSTIEGERAKQLGNIQRDAELMEPTLIGNAAQPAMNAYNFFNAVMSGNEASAYRGVEPVMTGSNSLNDFNLANYQNQLAYSRLYQPQQQQRQSPSFFGRLFGF